MGSTVPVRRGVRDLRRLLREEMWDLRQVEEEDFRSWLERLLAAWRRDPVFVQRARIHELRCSCPKLVAMEKEHRRRVAEDAASPQFARLSWLEQELRGARQAIAGLSAALTQADRPRQAELRRKLEAFRIKQQTLLVEQADCIRSSPQRQALRRINSELTQLRVAIGLDGEESRLVELLREQGRRGGRAGQAFERTADALTHRLMLPNLLRRGATTRCVHVLQGVTLGAARVEFDQLVIREPRRYGAPVEVLAAVEVKRNINDLAHGFRQRQENLAWLTRDSGAYDAEIYRTSRFRSGHFDVEATHVHEGETLIFTPHSFRRFRRDRESGLFFDHLYFITRSGPVWGLSSAALSRLAYRVATEEAWAPESKDYLHRLWCWGRSLVEPIESPDVLRMYAALTRRGRQILLVGDGENRST